MPENEDFEALIKGESNIKTGEEEKKPEGEEQKPAGEEKKPEGNELTIDSFIKEYGVESVDDFKKTYESLSEKAKKYEEESVVWQRKEKELNDSIAKEKENHKLFTTDDTLARLNILKNKGDEDYKFIAKMAIGGKDSLDPKAIIRKDMKDKYPDIADSKLDKLIDKKYGLLEPRPDLDDEVEEWELEREMAMIKLKEDAGNILSKYEDKLNNIELPYNKQPSKEEMILKQADAKKAWEPYLGEFVSSVGKMDLQISDDIKVPFELDKDDIAKYSELMGEIIHKNAIPFTKEAYANVAEVAKNIILKDKIQDIAHTVWEKAVEQNNLDWESKVNGSGISYKQKGKGVPATSEDEAFETLKEQFHY